MKLFLVVALSLILTGCFGYSSHRDSTVRTASAKTHSISPPKEVDQMFFTYRVEGKDAVLESDQVRLVFPGLSTRKRKAFSLKGDWIPVQIAGEGRAESFRICRRNLTTASLRSVYENGTNTLTFCGREVKFVDGGRMVLVGDRRVELRQEATEVIVFAANE